MSQCEAFYRESHVPVTNINERGGEGRTGGIPTIVTRTIAPQNKFKTSSTNTVAIYRLDNSMFTFSAYSLHCGRTPASRTGWNVSCGGVSSPGQYRSFKLSQIKSGSTDEKSVNASTAACKNNHSRY